MKDWLKLWEIQIVLVLFYGQSLLRMMLWIATKSTKEMLNFSISQGTLLSGFDRF